MKRNFVLALVLIFTITLLTACGSNNGSGGIENSDNSAGAESPANNTSTEARDIIKASELISNGDAATILGQDMKDGAITVQKPLNDEARYESGAYTLHVSICQEALYDKDNNLQKSLLKNG